jgi:hypothetical protein
MKRLPLATGLATIGLTVAGCSGSLTVEGAPEGASEARPQAVETHVAWDGTVSHAHQHPTKGPGYIALDPVGTVPSSVMDEVRQWQEGIYGDEDLPDGDVFFEPGQLVENCRSRVTREGGGWSYQEPSAEQCLAIARLVFTADGELVDGPDTTYIEPDDRRDL